MWEKDVCAEFYIILEEKYMKVYTTDKIRNVAVLGHGGSGKTTIVESMAFISGIVNRMGKVDDGNTISDYDKEEIKRGFSISTSVVPIEWNDVKINILDTPGFFDFVGEVEEAASAADAAVIVVDGKSGVEVGTQKAWDICEQYNLPRIICITGMDDANANFQEVVGQLQELYGTKITPFAFPLREGEMFVGYVDVISQKAFKYEGKGATSPADAPAEIMAEVEPIRESLVEAAAETSEELMDRYFDGEEFTDDEIRGALYESVQDGSAVPVLVAAGISALGAGTLLDNIISYFPSPDKLECRGTNIKTNEEFDADYDPSKPKSAYIFKTIVDPFIGKYSLIKVCSGVIRTDDVLYNEDRGMDDKIGKIYIIRGNKPIEVPELQAGDIGALAKLNKVVTTDTLSTKAEPITYAPAVISTPYTYMSYSAVNKQDVDKVSQSLQKIMQEDLTLKTVNDGANHQTLLYGIGDQQLDVVVSKLKDTYKVEITLEKPRVAFRETIRKKADAEYKHKKQTGGHVQYGHVKMTFEPSGDLETPYVFEQTVVGGNVPRNYYPAVEKGIIESVEKGPVAGYPVVGVKAVLYDGSYHPVDSSEMAFKTATVGAFKKGFMDAAPVLLEPISQLKVVVPDAFTGDIMGDLNKRRGRVLGMNPVAGGKQEIVADIPTSELFGYNTDLRSMTGGAGTFSYEFARYEQAPADVQEKEIAARAEEDA